MYQFYYADNLVGKKESKYQKSVWEELDITAVRPTMWEEHCLECSAPLCFEQCVHYTKRSDGRCKRFMNGILVSTHDKGIGKQRAYIKFRKWANMMTILFPAMLSMDDYNKLIKKNQRLGNGLSIIDKSPFPTNIRWMGIRTIEFLRRKSLRSMQGLDNQPDAFVFHGYSFENQTFRLIMEIFDDHTSVFKYSWNMEPGENMVILDKEHLGQACCTANYFVKIYPENDLEAEVEILWCDFVKGERKKKEKSAEKVKCVVWDLDNTVWDGTLIETEDENSLKLKASVLDTMKALDERGVIQSIASKNDFDNAWPVVEKLGIAEYFLYPQIHWNAKSKSIEQIAKSLNIGVDALALIDDSVFERQQVSSELKHVRVYDANEVEKLLSYSEFDVVITEESRKRRSMYKAEEKRRELQNMDSSDITIFLKKCHLMIDIFEPKTEEEIERCYELVIRTNQLNMTGRKYSREEFLGILGKNDVYNFAFSCMDDFGSYGIVGFGQYKIENRILAFKEFAMSCRVAGKYVESALFCELLKRHQCEKGCFDVIKTKKNELLRRTLMEIGFCIEKEVETNLYFKFEKYLKNADVVQIKCR